MEDKLSFSSNLDNQSDFDDKLDQVGECSPIWEDTFVTSKSTNKRINYLERLLQSNLENHSQYMQTMKAENDELKKWIQSLNSTVSSFEK